MPKLKTAINDSKAIAEKLESLHDFKVWLPLDPTRDEIIVAFDHYLVALESQYNLLIYCAGLGWLDESIDRGYWLSVDAQKGRHSKWLSSTNITYTLKSLNAKHVMVIADSCYYPETVGHRRTEGCELSAAHFAQVRAGHRGIRRPETDRGRW